MLSPSSPFSGWGIPPRPQKCGAFPLAELIDAEGLFRLLKGDVISPWPVPAESVQPSSSPLSAGRPVQGATRAVLGTAEANLLPLQLSYLFD